MKDVLITSSVLILVLLALRQVFRKTISRRVQYALWGLVLVRLLVPVSLPAVEHNVLTAAEPVRQAVSQEVEQRTVSVLPTGQVDLPAESPRRRGNRHSLRRLDDRSGAAPVCLAGRHCCDGTVFPGDQPAVLAKTL